MTPIRVMDVPTSPISYKNFIGGGGVNIQVYDFYSPPSFVGAIISSLTQGLSTDSAIKAGLRAAYLSVKSYHAVSDELHPKLFTERSIREWAPWKPHLVKI